MATDQHGRKTAVITIPPFRKGDPFAISAPNWKRYKDMRDIESNMHFMHALQKHKKISKELRQMREQYVKDNPNSMLMLSMYFIPFCPPIMPAISLENFLTWMAEGEPTIARKLKVKAL